MIDVTEIEKRIDRAVAATIPIKADGGGPTPQDLGQLMEFAKLMAVSGAAVPKFLRGNPGACLAICSRAMRSRMDPFALAEKAYMVVNKGEERVAFEAQAIHAIAISNAPLKGRLRYEILGDGDERRCKVWGTFKGETEPHVYTSEILSKLREARGRNEFGTLKGSPLWDTQPEVQLAYSAVRQWCRLFTPDVLLGIYAVDELQDGDPIDVTPKISGLAQRLKDAKQGERGFDAGHAASIIEGNVVAKEAENVELAEGRGSEVDDDGKRRGDERASVDPNTAGTVGGGGGDEGYARSAADQGSPHSEGDAIKPKPKGKRK